MALNALDTLGELENQGNQMGCINVPRGMDVYYPKAEGDVQAIIVPYVTTDCPIKGVNPGDLFYCRDYWRYRGLGATKKEFCIDNKKTFGERCAITESLANFGGELKDKPKSQRMCLFNLYFPDSDKMVLMEFSYANFAELLFEAVRKLAQRPKKAFVSTFADPVEGSLITFSWSEETFNGNKFYKAGAFEFEQHGGLDPEVLKRAANLDKCLAKMSYAEVSSMFLGEEDEHQEDEDVPPVAVNALAAKAKELAAKRAAAEAEVAKEPEPEVEAPKPEPVKAKKPAPKIEETAADEPEPETKAVPKKVKAGEGVPKSKASTWSKGAQCFYEGKECVVKKVDGDVITIAEKADDDERYKVGADQISNFKSEAPAAKETVKAEPSKEPDAFDADWDD